MGQIESDAPGQRVEYPLVNGGTEFVARSESALVVVNSRSMGNHVFVVDEVSVDATFSARKLRRKAPSIGAQTLQTKSRPADRNPAHRRRFRVGSARACRRKSF